MGAETAVLRQFETSTAALRSVTHEAWRISEGPGPREAIPLGVFETDSFEDALNATAPRCFHKDNLAILRTDAGRKQKVLRLYSIRQESKAVYRRNPLTNIAEPTRRLYPALLVELAVHEFSPVEPFRWSPGCDVVGIDREVVAG